MFCLRSASQPASMVVQSPPGLRDGLRLTAKCIQGRRVGLPPCPSLLVLFGSGSFETQFFVNLPELFLIVPGLLPGFKFAFGVFGPVEFSVDLAQAIVCQPVGGICCRYML